MKLFCACFGEFRKSCFRVDLGLSLLALIGSQSVGFNWLIPVPMLILRKLALSACAYELKLSA